MNMMQAVSRCFSQYATFDGRARRAEYWYFTLFNFIVSLILGLVQAGMGQDAGIADLYSLAVLVPGIAVGARRLHDIGRSGWWQLLWLVPLVGWIILLVWLATKGQPGSNAHGPNPKADEQTPAA